MPDIQKIKIQQEIQKYLNILSKKRYLFLVIFIFVSTMVTVYSFFAQKKYESSAIILVEKEKIINPLMRGLAVTQTPIDTLNTIRELILSRSRLLQVIKKLDLDLNIKTPLDLERLIDLMRKSIKINLIGKNLYRIIYEGEHPETVKNVTNTICNLFIEENLGATRGAAHDAYSFIETQLATYRTKLEESENTLRLFKEKNLGQMPGELNINMRKLDEYKNLLENAENELKAAELQSSLMEKQLSNESPLIVVFSSNDNSQSTDPFEAQLSQLNSKLNTLLMQYTEKYPEVINLKRQIEEIKKKKAEQTETENSQDSIENNSTGSTTEALNPFYQSLREDFSHIKIKISVLSEQLKEYKDKIELYKGKVESIPAQEQELAGLKRGYDVNQQIYQTLLNKLEEARISRELEIREKSDNFQIIDSAQLPLVPSKPNRPKLILLGLALGLGMGLAAIYAFNYFDNSIPNIDDAKRFFHYPILVGVPIIITNYDLKEKRKKNLIFFSIMGIFIMSIFVLLIKESPLFLMLKQSNLALWLRQLIV